jgi:translation initiation factor 5A
MASEHTILQNGNSLRKGGFIMLHGEPCRIKQLNWASPGKHGSGKIRVVGMGVFDNRHREEIVGSQDNAPVPMIEKPTLLLVDLEDDYMVVMTEAGKERTDLRLSRDVLSEELTAKIEHTYEEDEDAVEILLHALTFKERCLIVKLSVKY